MKKSTTKYDFESMYEDIMNNMSQEKFAAKHHVKPISVHNFYAAAKHVANNSEWIYNPGYTEGFKKAKEHATYKDIKTEYRPLIDSLNKVITEYSDNSLVGTIASLAKSVAFEALSNK